PWAAFSEVASRLGKGEVREQVNAILIELYPEFSDAAAELFRDAMKIKRTVRPEMTVGGLRSLVTSRYRWALDIDQTAPGARKYFWYRSEEHGENRRGERDIDKGSENETFVDVVGAVQALFSTIERFPHDMSVARFLMMHPE